MYKCTCHTNSGSIDISILSNESGRLVKNIFFKLPAQRRRQHLDISIIYLFITIFDVLIFIVMAINVLIFIFLTVSEIVFWYRRRVDSCFHGTSGHLVILH